MKRIISLLLTFAILISALSCITFAEGETVNLLDEDASTFEGGKASKYWTALGGGKIEIVDNPSGEGKVLKYSGASQSFSTPQLDLRPVLQEKLKSGETVYYKLSVYAEGGSSGTTVRIRDPKALISCLEGKSYNTLYNTTIDENTWVTVSGSIDITDEDLALTDGNWNLCFDGIMNKLTAIYIDNVFITEEEIEEVSENDKSIPEKTAITRPEKTLIGTIRWDAFEESTPNGTDAPSQVARVVSPAKYHWVAPFFANIENDGTVSFPEYTVKTWEQEAKYAVEGGLDYFAYLWYETSDIMSKPRKLHLQSEQKDTIKMCGILEGIKGKKSMTELYDAMKDSCYLRLDGHPVLFLYGLSGGKWTDKAIKQVRQEAVNAGIAESLYLVGMDSNKNNYLTNANKDIDAISWYSMNAVGHAEPYIDLAERVETAMKNIGSMCLTSGGKINIIPSFIAGRYTEPRIETGVKWVKGDPKAEKDEDKPYGNKFTLPPTMEEFKAHILNVFKYVSDNPNVTLPNMICSYGWNEHEEGGWLCPTLAVDENGNQLYNDDGSKKINNERLETLKSAIDEFYNGQNAEVATDAPLNEKSDGNFNVLYFVIPAGIIAVAVCCVAIVIKKKKKSDEK